MLEIVFAVAWFFLAAATDSLSVEWQEAREQRRAVKAGVLGAALECLTWAPLVLAIKGYWLVVVACVIGSAFGSWRAVARLGAKESTDA